MFTGKCGTTNQAQWEYYKYYNLYKPCNFVHLIYPLLVVSLIDDDHYVQPTLRYKYMSIPVDDESVNGHAVQRIGKICEDEE